MIIVYCAEHIELIFHSPVKPKETQSKTTSAFDFFGSSPVERASRKVFATKRKQVCCLKNNAEKKTGTSNISWLVHCDWSI